MSTVTLGKRKEREEQPFDPEAHGSTLFVSNLPYTATSTDLQTLFSDIAPVRSAFVVTEQGTGVSKGVGYVAFAIKEDAEGAFDKINKEGIALVGRKLRVQWADQKKDKSDPTNKDSSAATTTASKPRPPPRPAHPRLPHDPLAIRTIIVSGLPPSIDSKVLWKKIRKYEGAEKVDWPFKAEDGKEDPSTAHVLFTSPNLAQDAVHKLHAHVFKGHLLSVTLKKRLETLSKPVVQKSKSKTEDQNASPNKNQSTATAAAAVAAAPSHASRLIIRNLPFNATEQDLRAVFLPFGPIYSIHIPMDTKAAPATEDAPDAPARKPRTKGFAFVWMLSKKDAERAIEGCNGKVVRAGTAEELVRGKQMRKKVARLEKKARAGREHKEEGEENDIAEEGEDENMDGEEEDDKRATERVIAVDWALSKEKWKEEKEKMEGDDVEMADADADATSNDDDSDSSSGDSSSSEEDSDDEGDLGVHKGDDGSSDSEEDSDADQEDQNDEEPVKPQLPPPETGTTLFIRNVPFSSTEDELRTLFRSYGPLRYARITIDPSTGRSRGTGFACFWNKEDADKVIEQSELLRAETMAAPSSSAPIKKNPFSLPSILTPDPSSSLAQSLVLHGRTLDVVRAVTRDQAGKLREQGEKAREKADKRNMYLLREGVILPNTPAAESLTPAEVERRTLSFNARRKLLQSNPSLFISKTRLSIRQIPIFVTERMLKRLAIHAVKAFEQEVKKGIRSPLTEDEKNDMPDPSESDFPPEVKEELGIAADGKPKRRKFIPKLSGVKQAKIVRIAERVDPVSGKGRSKGYGFVEMNKHADALRVLRWANNNPDCGPLFEGWWKEELEALLKAEKGKPGADKDGSRVKRIKEELERGAQKKAGKGNLIAEFSIENVQVVQRRNAAALKGKLGLDAEKPSRRTEHKLGARSEEAPSKKGVKTEEPSPKKRKVVSEEKKPKPAKEESAKPATTMIGSLIGRKRKERKSGKGKK